MTTSMEPHCLPFREVPHTTKLFAAFTEEFKRVQNYFGHPPTESGILAAAKEVRLDPEARRTVVEVLREQNARFAPDSPLPPETAKGQRVCNRADGSMGHCPADRRFRSRQHHTV